MSTNLIIIVSCIAMAFFAVEMTGVMETLEQALDPWNIR